MLLSYEILQFLNCDSTKSTAPLNLSPTATIRSFRGGACHSFFNTLGGKSNKPQTKDKNRDCGHTSCSSCVSVFGNADGLMAQMSWVSRRTLDHLLIWAAHLTAPSSRYWWRATHSVDKMVLMSRPRGVNQHSNRGKLGFPIRIRATQLVLCMESKVIFFQATKKTPETYQF